MILSFFFNNKTFFETKPILHRFGNLGNSFDESSYLKFSFLPSVAMSPLEAGGTICGFCILGAQWRHLSPLPTVPPLPLRTAHHLSKRTKMFLRRKRKYEIDSIRGSFFQFGCLYQNKVNDFFSITNHPPSSPTYGSPLIEENQNVPQEEKKI